jgi:4-amino-4-deoxy-L-arabinose transferase-like glycosyltransferase
VLCALALALLAPFLGKPLHSDDPVFVWAAQHIVHHALDFYGTRVNWEGHEQPMTAFFESPPLTSYVLAAASAVVGWNEVGMHAVFLVFNLLTVVGVYALAERFCTRPLLAAMMFLLCPAFLVSATTLMAEPVMLCLWVWSLVLWIRGSDRSPWTIPVAGVVLSAAVMSKYFAVCLIPLAVWYALLNPASRRVRVLQIAALILPVLTLIVYERYTASVYGRGLLLSAFGYASRSQNRLSIPIAARVLDTLAFLGGSVVVVWLAWLSVARRMSIALFAVAVALLALITRLCFAAPPLWASGGGGWAFFIQYGILAGGGLVVAAAVVQAMSCGPARWLTRDGLFMLAWIGGVAAFVMFLNWSINIRSILPLVPAVCIVAARCLQATPRATPRRVGLVLVSGGAVALAVAVADYRLAVISRDAARELSAAAATAIPPGGELWFAGHSGFQYYMQAAGAKAVEAGESQLRVGDVVIFPLNAYGASPGGQGFAPLGVEEFGGPRWVATMQSRLGASFYVSYGQGLPFVFGSVPAEAFLIERVTPQSRLYE